MENLGYSIMDYLIKLVCNMLVYINVFIMELFTGLMSTNLNDFDRIFPFAGTAYNIMIAIGISLASVIMLFGVLKNYGLPIGLEAENPVYIAMRFILAVITIVSIGPFLRMVTALIDVPIRELLSLSSQAGEIKTLYTNLSPTGAFVSTITKTAVDNGIIAAGALTGPVGIVSAAVILLLPVTALVVLMISTITLYVKMFTRYVTTGVLLYLAPVPLCTMSTKSTASVAGKYFMMFITQLLLLIIDIWGIRLFHSGLVNAGNALSNPITFIFWILMCYGLTKALSKTEEIAFTIGANPARVRSDLQKEMMSVLMMTTGKFTGKSMSKPNLKVKTNLFGNGELGGAANNEHGTSQIPKAEMTSEILNGKPVEVFTIEKSPPSATMKTETLNGKPIDVFTVEKPLSAEEIKRNAFVARYDDVNDKERKNSPDAGHKDFAVQYERYDDIASESKKATIEPDKTLQDADATVIRSNDLINSNEMPNVQSAAYSEAETVDRIDKILLDMGINNDTSENEANTIFETQRKLIEQERQADSGRSSNEKPNTQMADKFRAFNVHQHITDAFDSSASNGTVQRIDGSHKKRDRF